MHIHALVLAEDRRHVVDLGWVVDLVEVCYETDPVAVRSGLRR